MFTLDLEIEGEEQAWADMRKFEEVVKRPFKSRVLTRDTVVEFHRVERKQFSTEGTFGGKAWPALSPKYRSWKERHYPGKSILRRTDKLFKSLTKKTSDSIVRVTDRGAGLTLGSTVSYGKYHRSKSAKKRRAPLDFPVKDIEAGTGKMKFLSIVETDVLKQFKKLSRGWEVEQIGELG